MMSQVSEPFSSSGGGSPCGSVGGTSGDMGHSHMQATPPSDPLSHTDSGSGSGSESHGKGSHGYASVEKDSSHSSKSSPPCSSNGFSLGSSEQNAPSSSGCSSEQSRRAERHREVLRVVRKLKQQVAPDSRVKSSNTLHTLKYALRCVQLVSAKDEYYQTQQLDGAVLPPVGVAYSLQQIDDIIAEHTHKNADVCVVCVCLECVRVVYASGQASAVLRCKQEVFQRSKFTQLISPQDLATYHTHTSPHRLAAYDGSSTGLLQDKPFFCRISGEFVGGAKLECVPFRMRPYLIKLHDPQLTHTHSDQHTHSGEHSHTHADQSTNSGEHSDTHSQLCCLLLAERVHSGYEVPRLSSEKRVFTTTHTPRCVIQDIDERAVPLLGYLPQDLIGSSLLLHLHPADRPALLTAHHKMVRGGVCVCPLVQSSVRFRVRSGHYVTMETSWSCYVNPWSRRVALVMGQHTIRTPPVPEDVFAAPDFSQPWVMDTHTQQLAKQIHTLLLQPVVGGAAGSHSNSAEVGVASGSRSNSAEVGVTSGSHGNNAEVTSSHDNRTEEELGTQAACEDEVVKTNTTVADCTVAVYKTKDGELSVMRESATAPQAKEGSAAPDDNSQSRERDNTRYSYQQISCLNGVIRYLDSYNLKRKGHQSSSTSSEDDKNPHDPSLSEATPPPTMRTNRKPPPAVPTNRNAPPAMSQAMMSLTPPTKAESATSQCSYSSTIVHVGDKKEANEEAESPVVAPPPEPTAYQKLGLTKQLLAAHTQKEEMDFIARHTHTHAGLEESRTSGWAGFNSRRCGLGRRAKKPRVEPPDSSDSAASQRRPLPPLQGLNQTSWSPSETAPSSLSSNHKLHAPHAPPSVTSHTANHSPNTPAPPSLPSLPSPLAAPVMAVLVPAYFLPPAAYTSQQHLQAQAAYNSQQHLQPQAAYNSQQHLQPQAAYTSQQHLQPHSAYNSQQHLQAAYSSQAQTPALQYPAFYSQHPLQLNPAFNSQQTPLLPMAYNSQHPPAPQPSFSSQQPPSATFTHPMTYTPTPHTPTPSPISPSASRCSSPLNLLQLGEHTNTASTPSVPKEPLHHTNTASTPTVLKDQLPHSTLRVPEDQLPHSTSQCTHGYRCSCSHSATSAQEETLQASHPGDSCCDDDEDQNADGVHSDVDCSNSNHGGCNHGDGNQGDESSSSSEMAELLLQQDQPCSPAGSSSSKVCAGQIDSSLVPRGRGQGEGRGLKCVLQEPLWLLLANADENVMMTYQLPARDPGAVLREDRERLRRMQKNQPRFTSQQRRELTQTHPWIRTHTMPTHITKCVYCEDDVSGPMAADPQVNQCIMEEEAEPSSEEGPE
ncbi:period circadian protein homolog 2-like [Engraulis encrasicolus]|uniref:period circadian protein homolog 2-like n=1 Tax=Engraulis encrasicolus TaxID=184585 RepID=UPI002FD3EB3A